MRLNQRINGDYTMDVKIDSNIKNFAVKIDKIEKNAPKIMKRYGELLFFPNIKFEIEKLVSQGGSSKSQYSWGYWQRKRGGRFTYVKAKGKNFTNGWKNNGGTVRYPIHPMSYLARKNRKMPKSGQFALYDTGELVRSFRIMSSFSGIGMAQISIGSSSFKLDYHEKTFKYKREISRPVFEIFVKNKKLHNNFFSKVQNDLERI